MNDPSSKSREHRMRVLEHQVRLAAEAASRRDRPEVQRNIPLIVEVTGGAGSKSQPVRRARRKPGTRQPGFNGL